MPVVCAVKTLQKWVIQYLSRDLVWYGHQTMYLSYSAV